MRNKTIFYKTALLAAVLLVVSLGNALASVSLADDFDTGISAVTNDQNLAYGARQTGTNAPNAWDDLNWNTTASGAWDDRVSVTDLASGHQLKVSTGAGEQGQWNPGQTDLYQNSSYKVDFDVKGVNGWAFVRFNSTQTGDNKQCGFIVLENNLVAIYENGGLAANLGFLTPTGTNGLHHIEVAVSNGLASINVDNGAWTGTRSWTTIGTGASGIGYFSVHSESGADAYLDNFVYEATPLFVDPKTRGAIGDGITDDTATIQGIIDEGNHVLFSAGSYLVSTLTMGGIGQQMSGTNTSIIPVGNQTYVIHITGRNSLIDGIRFDMANNGQLYGIGVSAGGATVSNCVFTGDIGHHILVNSDDALIANNTFDGTDAAQTTALVMSDADGFTASGNNFINCTGFNLQTRWSGNGQITGNSFHNPVYRMAQVATSGQTVFVYEMPAGTARYGLQVNGLVPGNHVTPGYSITHNGNTHTVTLNLAAGAGDVVELFAYRSLEPLNINAGSININISGNVVDGSGDSGVVVGSDYNANHQIDPANPADFPEGITIANNEVRNIYAAGIALLHLTGTNHYAQNNYIIDTAQSFANSVPWSTCVFRATPSGTAFVSGNAGYATVAGTPKYLFTSNVGSEAVLLGSQNRTEFREGAPAGFDIEATTVFQQDPSVNYNNNEFVVGTESNPDSTNGAIRTLMSFDVSALGQDVRINSATLCLTHTGSGAGTTTRIINVYELDSVFDETTATWNTHGNGETGDRLTYAIGQGSTAAGTPITFASTHAFVGFVQNAVDGNEVFNMVLMADELEEVPVQTDETLKFYSDDYSGVDAVKPLLKINYSLPAKIEDWSLADGNFIKLVVNAPDAYPSIYSPKATTSLMDGAWADVPHSYTNDVATLALTNLSYSTTEGTNKVIYVEADEIAEFYKIIAE